MSFAFYFKYYLYLLITAYEGAPIIIRITVLLATFLVVIFIFSLAHIAVLNGRHLREKRIKNQFINSYRKNATEILCTPHTWEDFTIKKHLGRNRDLYNNKKLKIYSEELIEIITEIKKSDKKLNHKNLIIVLDYFHLPSYWQNIISKGRLKKRQEALRDMDELEHLLSGSLLMKSINHTNKDFRKQARAAFIEYEKNDPYKFFEESFDTDFNALDEIRLHHYLKRKSQKHGLPHFSRWVENATNNQFKQFIIKEIGLLKQYNCADFLIQLLDSESNIHIQKQIIDTLGVLNYKAADTKLILMYSSSLILVQKAIIATLARLRTEKTLLFLAETYKESHDSSIKIQLAYALNDYGIEGQRKIKTLSKTNDNFDLEILAQVNFANIQKKRQNISTV